MLYTKYFTKKLVVLFIGISLIGIVPVSVDKCIAMPTYEKQNNNFYSSYDQLTDLLQLLQSQYPDVFSYHSLGKTYQGRDIWLVKISDNVEATENETQILITGGVHGNEKPGFQAVIYSIKTILENYTTTHVNESLTSRVRNIVNNTELYFIPMANPDGVEAFTRKNCAPNECLFGKMFFRGVDINRNFDYNWDDPYEHPFRYIVIPRSWDQLRILLSRGSNTRPFEQTAVRHPMLDVGFLIRSGFYRGVSPMSENESKAIQNFIETHHITISVDYHIFGEEIRYPQPGNYAHLLDGSTFYGIAENISKLNGYEIYQRMNWSNLSGNYEYWSYLTHGTFTFIIELCDSMDQNKHPDESYLLRLFDSHFYVNLYLAEKAMAIDYR